MKEEEVVVSFIFLKLLSEPNVKKMRKGITIVLIKEENSLLEFFFPSFVFFIHSFSENEKKERIPYEKILAKIQTHIFSIPTSISLPDTLDLK